MSCSAWPTEPRTSFSYQITGSLNSGAAPIDSVCGWGITGAQAVYAQEVAKKLRNQGLGVATDLRNEKINLKIREHSMQKLPFILVMGDKEKEVGAVAVRARGNVDLGVMPVDDFIAKITADIASKA
jgi:threonyl-tRNA synthetase